MTWFSDLFLFFSMILLLLPSPLQRNSPSKILRAEGSHYDCAREYGDAEGSCRQARRIPHSGSPGLSLSRLGYLKVKVAQSCPTLCDPMDYIWSMEFSRPEYWSGLPFPSLGDFPNLGIKPRSSVLQVDSLPPEPQGKPTV